MTKFFDIPRQTGSRPKRPTRHLIREWREHRGFTAAALAEKADMTGSFISQIENGRAGYTERSLEKLALALEVEPWQLLGDDPGKPPYEVDQAAWDTLTDTQRRLALQLGENLQKSQGRVLHQFIHDLAASRR